MKRGQFLTDLIEDRGFNVMSLSKASGVPYTTIRSMIERNLTNASIDNVIKICKVLDISVETLVNPKADEELNEPQTIAAHKEGEEWTEEELKTIEEFKAFVRSQRKNKE